MASNAPVTLARDPRVWHYVRLAIGGILTAAIGGLFAAFFTYMFTARQNTEAALQQQYLSAVQEFISSGSRVDASITDLADSILDGQNVRDARQEARQAVAAHVAATQSLSQVVGKGNSNLYMEGVATLRTLVDEANSAQSVRKLSSARFDLMENRGVIVQEARKRIYGTN